MAGGWREEGVGKVMGVSLVGLGGSVEVEEELVVVVVVVVVREGWSRGSLMEDQPK